MKLCSLWNGACVVNSQRCQKHGDRFSVETQLRSRNKCSSTIDIVERAPCARPQCQWYMKNNLVFVLNVSIFKIESNEITDSIHAAAAYTEGFPPRRKCTHDLEGIRYTPDLEPCTLLRSVCMFRNPHRGRRLGVLVSLRLRSFWIAHPPGCEKSIIKSERRQLKQRA